MRLLNFILLATFSISMGWVSANAPEQPRVMQYSRLWTNSPFTIKPAQEAVAAASPLERDWMLGSIRPSGNGYSVTLINTKDRKNRVRFIPGFSSGDFKLLEVKQDPNSSKQSKVLISKGSQKGWITYDEKLIKVRVAAASKKPTKKKSSSRTIAKPTSHRSSPPVPGRSGSKKTAPRVRHVPRK